MGVWLIAVLKDAGRQSRLEDGVRPTTSGGSDMEIRWESLIFGRAWRAMSQGVSG